MDRTAWLRERRRMTEERFDTLYAATYDQDDVPITPTHRRFVTNLAAGAGAGVTALRSATPV